MPVVLNLISLDQAFYSASSPPIIVNDLANRSEEDREYFNSLIRQTYTTDMVSMLPQCRCGESKGEHLVGVICDECGHAVKQSIEDDVTPNLWFRKPEGIPKLINPIVFTMLSKRFAPSKFKIMNWLVDRAYSGPSPKIPEVVKRMQAAGIQRGYTYFIENFDAILDWLFAQPEFKIAKKNILNYFIDMLQLTHPSRDPLRELIATRRDAVFCDYLPLPNRSLLVLEKTALGGFVDATTVSIQDTLNTMLSIDRDFHDRSPTTIESRTGRILCMLSAYYTTLFNKSLSPKPALLRKHVYGSRLNMAFRALITSHEDIADHDEIHLPWCVGMTTWRLHIMNILMRPDSPYGAMMHNEASEFLTKHVYKYHPVLDDILQSLCKPKGYKGAVVLMQRN